MATLLAVVIREAGLLLVNRDVVHEMRLQVAFRALYDIPNSFLFDAPVTDPSCFAEYGAGLSDEH